MLRQALLTVAVAAALVWTGCAPSSNTASLAADAERCMGCGACVSVCNADAIRIIENKAVIDPAKCVRCGKCVETCPVGAIW